MDVDVLVVGAGPTGLTLAAGLAATGVRARVVDRLADRVHESRALAVQPRSLEVLRGIGVADELVRRGDTAVGLRLHGRGRVAALPAFDAGLDDTAYPFLLFLSQADTEAVLGARVEAAGVRVERRVELVSLDTRADRVVAGLRHGEGTVERVEAAYVVGCDGAHSAVRGLAGIGFAGGSYPQTYLLADLEVDGDLEPRCVHAYLGDAGVLFFFPLGRPAPWRMLGVHPSPAAPEPSAPPELADLQRVADAFSGGEVRLRDPVWRTYFRLHHRRAAAYRAGRVFLAGDAAHVHSPAGAQGMNTGIQDAANLAWKLALAVRDRAGPGLLESYAAEREPVGGDVLRFTDRLTRVAMSRSPVVRAVRTRVVPRVAPLVGGRSAVAARVRARAFRAASQLDVRYRGSPLVEEGRPSPRSGPRAGDRLPDGPATVDGVAGRLHDALAGPTAYTLLLCGPGSWAPDRVAALLAGRDDVLVAHRVSAPAVVPRPAVYLIRPDGHVAFRCAGADLAGVERHLARALPRRPPSQPDHAGPTG